MEFTNEMYERFLKKAFDYQMSSGGESFTEICKLFTTYYQEREADSLIL